MNFQVTHMFWLLTCPVVGTLQPGGGSVRPRGPPHPARGRLCMETWSCYKVAAKGSEWVKVSAWTGAHDGVHAHAGTVQIWGWTSSSPFQSLPGCWRRCNEPWRLRGRQIFDHVTTSPSLPVLLITLRFPKAPEQHVKFASSLYFQPRSNQDTTTAERWLAAVTRSLPVYPWWPPGNAPPAETVRWSGRWWRWWRLPVGTSQLHARQECGSNLGRLHRPPLTWGL